MSWDRQPSRCLEEEVSCTPTTRTEQRARGKTRHRTQGGAWKKNKRQGTHRPRHTEECRRRFEEIFGRTEEGRLRMQRARRAQAEKRKKREVEKNEERGDRERSEEGDTDLDANGFAEL